MMDELEKMLGKTAVEIIGAEQHSELIEIRFSDGSRFTMYHQQDCCESVSVEDVAGDIADLIGSPVLLAECVSNSDDPPSGYCDSHTWTFYKFATVKGHVTLRWLGESNGYYSEEVATKWMEQAQ